MSQTPETELSPREIELLALVVTGATNQQIARALDISINTVKAHLRNIFGKLEVESRTEASMVAVQRGLIVLNEDPGEAQEGGGGTLAEHEAEKAESLALPAWRMPWIQKVALWAVLVAAVLVAVWPRAGLLSMPASDQMVDLAQEQMAPSGPSEVARWEPRAQLPTPRGRFALAKYDRRLYAISGLSNQGWTDRVEAYDPSEDIWVRVAPKPMAVANVSAAVVGERVYVPGGLLADNHLTDVVEIYDPVADTWTQGPSLPQPLCAYGVAASDDALYLFGGWDGKDYLDAVLRLDLQRGVWEQVATLATPTGFAGVASVGDLFYLLGGFDGERSLATCTSFSPDLALAGQDPWVTHSPMRAGRAGHGVALVGETIYVIGGGWQENLDFNESYDVSDDAWTTFPTPLSGQWKTLGAAPISSQAGDLIVAVGGWHGQYLGAVQVYQATFRVFLP